MSFVEEYLKTQVRYGEMQTKRKTKLQWFQFPSGLVFQNNKFGTTNVALFYNVKDAISASKYSTVDPTGLEPATPSLQMMCSTR